MTNFEEKHNEPKRLIQEWADKQEHVAITMNF